VYEITLKDNGVVEIIGCNKVKSQYPSEDNLPADIRVKLSALKLISPPEEFEHVGQRVTDTIFWIYD
jgi:hypothetical protein